MVFQLPFCSLRCITQVKGTISLTFGVGIIDLSIATRVLLSYICILLYIILSRHIHTVSSHFSSSFLYQMNGFRKTFQWLINRLLHPPHLPPGLMPPRIRNQICHRHRSGADNTMCFWGGPRV